MYTSSHSWGNLEEDEDRRELWSLGENSNDPSVRVWGKGKFLLINENVNGHRRIRIENLRYTIGKEC